MRGLWLLLNGGNRLLVVMVHDRRLRIAAMLGHIVLD